MSGHFPYPQGENPERDAWYTAFFIENHLDYFTHPEHAATPEQVRFMVYTEDDERYYPCSDRMFEAIINRNQSKFLQKRYRAVLQRIIELIEMQIEDTQEKNYLDALINIKFTHETRDEIMIPSRLEKRLMRIFLNRTQIEDPYLDEKARRNRRVAHALDSEAFRSAMNHLDPADFRRRPTTLTGMRELAEHIVIKRLISLTVENALWETDQAQTYTKTDYLRLFSRSMTGNGVNMLLNFLGIQGIDGAADAGRTKRILWLANEAGEVMVDLAIIHYLTKLGHQIILAFKEGPLFTKITFQDAQRNEVLSKELDGALFITENKLSKNDLVKTFRGDTRIIALSDGTSEDVNLLLVSTTFARIFKEVDGIITRGHDQRRRFFDTHFQFTQNIYNIARDAHGAVEIAYKPKHPSAIKFSHADLEKKAKAIIEQLANANAKGMTEIFYSGIIGSIPGKIKIAKKIMATTIQYLKNQLAMTFIINPSEYFEPGMDADDLMYMWEIVQTSGLIDIWRFQTYDDIVQAFQIMGKRVPPEWVGKDATFSTGCTKEMNIAMQVQAKHPEMQIIGPAKEKFMRRTEYGVGKMYDKRFGEVFSGGAHIAL
ncbi:MAG: hypothetical protein JSW39_06040 [Desulfobacterales bacterium]|nr:MAG: hypothetical protein JSW39_06040 [Desulfobacterales bacterium]